jgi:hypothetical protein
VKAQFQTQGVLEYTPGLMLKSEKRILTQKALQIWTIQITRDVMISVFSSVKFNELLPVQQQQVFSKRQISLFSFRRRYSVNI